MRAQKARDRFLAFKRRSLASKKGWETRWRASKDELFGKARDALKAFQETHDVHDYTKFQKAKRALYAVFPEEAYELMTQAAEEADWTSSVAMRFAKLS